MKKDFKRASLWALGGLIGLVIMSLVLIVGTNGRIILITVDYALRAGRESVNTPNLVTGKVLSGTTRTLTPSEVLTVCDWLAQHQSGWSPRISSEPRPTLYILLDTASQREAVGVEVWAGPKQPGWNGVVVFRYPAQKKCLIRKFEDHREPAPLLALARS
jgi:hypothetical protein